MKTSHSARRHAFASLIATAALLSGITLPARAADHVPGGRAKTISLADIDLSTISGQEAARERVHQTARQLCGQVADELDLSHSTNFVKCVDEATAAALPRLDAMIHRESGIRTAAIGQPRQ